MALVVDIRLRSHLDLCLGLRLGPRLRFVLLLRFASSSPRLDSQSSSLRRVSFDLRFALASHSLRLRLAQSDLQYGLHLVLASSNLKWSPPRLVEFSVVSASPSSSPQPRLRLVQFANLVVSIISSRLVPRLVSRPRLDLGSPSSICVAYHSVQFSAFAKPDI